MHRPILRVLAAAAAAALGLTPTGCGTTASRAPRRPDRKSVV